MGVALVWGVVGTFVAMSTTCVPSVHDMILMCMIDLFLIVKATATAISPVQISRL